MNKNEILIQYRMEQKFGKIFETTMKELYNFIEDEIDNGATEKEIINLMYKLYRDDVIDIKSLKNIVEYLGRELPLQMEYHGEKAKTIIRDLVQYCPNESELLKRIFHEYQIGSMNIDICRLCVTLMGYRFSSEFEKMSDQERRNSTWIYDLNGDMVKIDSNYKKFIDVYTGILNLENTGLLAPSFPYINNYDFIDDYMLQKDIKNKDLKNAGLYRKYKAELKQKGFKRKIDVFRMIITLNLPSSIAKQFLNICGFNFDPFDEKDMFILDYLNGKYEKKKTFQEFADMFNEKFEFSEKKPIYFEWPNWE